MNAKNGLSIVSVVCNEERALSYQLPLIRELTTDLTIVVQESQDKTYDICCHWADNVLPVDCSGFCETHRALAIGRAKKKWVLVLDADEIPTYQFVEALPSLMKYYEDVHLYGLPIYKIQDGMQLPTDFVVHRLGVAEKMMHKQHLHCEPYVDEVDKVKDLKFFCLTHIKSQEDWDRDEERYKRLNENTRRNERERST
jgi:hypothetical protein